MGCGCSKGRSLGDGSSSASLPRRVTVYQVLSNGNVLSEYDSLPVARKEAVAVGGRVKVTSKVI